MQQLPSTERRSKTRIAKGERGIWQRRFWEHAIPTKTITCFIGLRTLESDEAWCGETIKRLAISSFHRYVRDGLYPDDWASGLESQLELNERE